MTAQVESERLEALRDVGLVHVADTCCPPFDHTLCGRPITPRCRQRDVAATCVVCAQIERNIVRCPRCRAEVITGGGRVA